MALLVLSLAARVEAPLSRLARFGPRGRGEGFWSGLLVGAGLGFVYAPCAGPILAAVVSVSATQGATGELVAVALGYAAGSALVLLLVAYGGGRGGRPLRPGGRGPPAGRGGREGAGAGGSRRTAGLPVLGSAPDFTGNDRWFNTRANTPLRLDGLRGRVVLIDFWTYTCINCIRTLPYLRAWDGRYREHGLTIVGVHTPEFVFEREAENVREAIAANRIRYPVAQDNEYATWSAWGNQYWPAKYLIDARGRVRYAHFGEGAYEETEAAIRALLAEAGRDRLGPVAEARVETASPELATPETYLGYERAERFLPGPPRPGFGRYESVDELPPVHFALSGEWRVSGESATAVRDPRIDARVTARKVFLVLSSE